MSAPLDTRGYTFVELLMSLSILSLGVTGVIAMQKVTVTSNQHAKNLAIATQISQSWMDELRADSLMWNHPSSLRTTSDLDDTTWLTSVALQNTDWSRPAWSATRSFGPGFDAQGRPVDTTTSIDGVRFCTHLRLSWLYQPLAGSVTGNGLMRAETRVFWLREGQRGLQDRPVCDAQEEPNDIGAETSRYHFLYTVSALRQNTSL